MFFQMIEEKQKKGSYSIFSIAFLQKKISSNIHHLHQRFVILATYVVLNILQKKPNYLNTKVNRTIFLCIQIISRWNHQ